MYRTALNVSRRAGSLLVHDQGTELTVVWIVHFDYVNSQIHDSFLVGRGGGLKSPATCWVVVLHKSAWGPVGRDMSSSWVAVGRPHKSHHSSQRHPLIRELGTLLKDRALFYTLNTCYRSGYRRGGWEDVEGQVAGDGVSWFLFTLLATNTGKYNQSFPNCSFVLFVFVV